MKPLDIAATAEASGTPVRKSYNDGPAGVALLGMVSEAEQGIAAKSARLRQRAPIAGASVFNHQAGFRNHPSRRGEHRRLRAHHVLDFIQPMRRPASARADGPSRPVVNTKT